MVDGKARTLLFLEFPSISDSSFHMSLLSHQLLLFYAFSFSHSNAETRPIEALLLHPPEVQYLPLKLTLGAEPLLRTRQLCSYSRTSQHFMEP
jgi:hypothetical protein